MARKPLKIIGINPGTRYMGVAVFDGPELIDWRIKVLDGKWSKKKMIKAIGIISDFIGRYDLNVLVIKRLHPSRRSQNLAQLVVKIKEFSRRKGLRIIQYSIKDLERFFISEEKPNKKNLAEAIVSEYPALFYELKKEKSNRNFYYIRVIEAAALASAHFRQVDNN